MTWTTVGTTGLFTVDQATVLEDPEPPVAPMAYYRVQVVNPG
jgi:hypothetical protein